MAKNMMVIATMSIQIHKQVASSEFLTVLSKIRKSKIFEKVIKLNTIGDIRRPNYLSPRFIQEIETTT
ncbi:hypothetical protein WNX13_11545, partial [Lactobacillus delbrueckii]|uniref:hypothetical protein n=1 Tax=Lactobacillus delbrueckii TaxID=1584 RepID=UPI0030E7F4E3